MAEALHTHLPAFVGEATLVLFLYTDAGVLVNAGGDAMAESPATSGRFQATLTEPRVGLGVLAARVYDGAESPDNLVWDGWLDESMSLIIADYPVSGGSGGMDELVPELAAPPAALSSLADKLTYIFMWHKNKSTQDEDERTLYADNSATVVATEAVDDNGVMYTKEKGV